MAESMVVIREFANEFEATIAERVLAANNIPALVIRDNAGGMLPVMHYVYPVRLAVRPGDAELALDLLDSSFDDSDIDDTLDDLEPE